MALKKQAGTMMASARDTVKTLVYAVLIALVFRTVLAEPFNIPSGSMIPTLLVGDYLFVTKYSYGYSKHSFPFSPPLFEGRIFEKQPKRGDVVVFKLPSDNTTDYIKRLVGLPGDRIQVIKGVLYVNGEAVKRDWKMSYIYRKSSISGTTRADEYVETLPGGVRHAIIEETDEGRADNTEVFVVPPGNFFAMGDNRDNSEDSRFSVGFVPAENLVGRAEFIFFSYESGPRIWEVWKWPQAIRFDRIFQAIR